MPKAQYNKSSLKLAVFFMLFAALSLDASASWLLGQNIEFKSVVPPIVAGTILVAFTGFIAMTSTTFGFASPNTSMLLNSNSL